MAEFMFRLEKITLFLSIFLSPNLTKNQVGLTLRLENYLFEIKILSAPYIHFSIHWHS